MADQFPQYQDSEPVFQPQHVVSSGEGYEDLAKTLGSISQRSEENAVQVESEQSQSMYINSVANVEQLKKTAQMQLLQHPEQANKIAQNVNDSIDVVKQNAFVNKKDRGRLNAYVSDAMDDVQLDSVRTSVEQSKREALFTHYANWPDQLKAYQDSLLTDHDQSEHLKNAMVSSLHSLVTSGAMTPEQAGGSLKAMQSVVESSQDLHNAMNATGGVSAKDYHALTSSPLNQGSAPSNAPIDGNTGWMIDYYNNDKSFQGVQADIANRKFPNPQTFVSLKPAERQRAIMEIQGVKVADGYINSGAGFPEIEKTFQELNGRNNILSYRDQATHRALGKYIDNLKSGNFLNVMQQTPAGNAIMEDFNKNNAALANIPVSDPSRNQFLLANKNQLIDRSISYGQAHHIPSEYIKPIPPNEIAAVQNAFTINGNPTNALSIMSTYSKQNQRYVATSMKNPDQRLILEALSNSNMKIPDQTDLIAANQQGRVYETKELSKEKDRDLATRAYTNLSDQFKLLQYNYGFDNAQVLQNSMLDTTLRYAKFLAQKNGDLTFSHGHQWVDQASQIYKDSFPSMSSTNYVVNPKQLPEPMTRGQLDYLSNYMIDQAKQRLGDNQGKFDVARDLSPLKMIFSPTNDVMVVDGDNQVVYTTPYTSNLMALAHNDTDKKFLKQIVGQSMVFRSYGIQ